MDASAPAAVPEGAAVPWRRRAALWLTRPENAAFAAAVAVDAVLILWTALVTLQRFPNAGDEYAYLLSAEMYSEGRLWVPSPEPRHFFDFHHTLNDGRFYGKYPPGWPLVLMLGVFAGAPWLVNPVLGIVALFQLRALARRHFPGAASGYASVFLTANTFFIFNSASHFAHASCLSAILLGLHGFLNWWEDPKARRDAVLAGAAAGLAFLIRPFTALLLLAPAGFALLGIAVRRRAWKDLALAALPLFAAVGLFLLYDTLMTGNPFVQPFTQYSAIDRPMLPETFGQFLKAFGDGSAKRLWALGWPWLPFCWLLILPALIRPPSPERRKAWLLAGSVALLYLGFGFYPYDGGIGYGPRYAYEALGPVVLLMAASCARFPRAGPNAALVVLALNAALFLVFSGPAAEDIRGKTELYETAKRAGLTNAIVFLETGSGTGHPGDLARNGIHFDGPVFFVRDHGVGNREMADAYPARKAWVYRWNEATRRGSLRPWAR